MKNTIKIIIGCLVFLLVFQACGSKRMVKKAIEFEQQGLYTIAADYYLKALYKNDKNTDAIIGLKKNGQLAFHDLVKDFESHHKQDNHKEAVYQYLKLKGYKNNASQYGVIFTIPARILTKYRKNKDYYLNNLYHSSNNLLDQNNFDLAMIKLKEIERFDNNYKDIQDLKLYAQFEPQYRDAKKLMKDGKPRLAYQKFHELAGYRNSESKKEIARKEASLSILILPFYNNSKEYNISVDLEDKIVANIVDQQNPFIQIIENRQNLSPLNRDIYHGNKTGKYPNYKNKSKQLKAKAVLIGEILLFDKRSNRVKAEETNGYSIRLITSTLKDDSKVTRKVYDKITYSEHKGSSKINMHFSYKLISTETGETLFAEVIELIERDEIHYASYEGESSSLVPGDWKFLDKSSEKDYLLDKEKDVQQLQDLFGARKKLTSIPELKLELINKIAFRAADGILRFNPEL